MVCRHHQFADLAELVLWFFSSYLHHTIAGGSGTLVGQVEDIAVVLPINKSMWVIDIRGHIIRMPVIAPRGITLSAHPLLHDCPFAFIAHDKIVGVQLE